MNGILNLRLSESTKQKVSIELMDKDLESLAGNINRCLKAEEKLRLKVVHEEERFKDTIADISHDFRTPLTAIRAYLQLMQKEDIGPEQKKQLDVIVKHADYLGDLIEHFFEYSYLLDTTPNVVYQHINITNLITEKIADAAVLFENANITPEISEKMCFASCDKAMMERVFENLIKNTIAHAKGYLKVYFTEQTENDICFQIIHFENEIEENDHIDTEQLFNRFYVANQERKTTGLGLAIVKILTEQQGGKVVAEIHNEILDIQIWIQSKNMEEKVYNSNNV